METYWEEIFEELKDFRKVEFKAIQLIIQKDDAEEKLYIEIKRCFELFIKNRNKEHNFHHIPHIAVILAYLNSEKSEYYLKELIKIDIDYFHYFFDEVTSECLHFIYYKLGEKRHSELLETLKDESIADWNRCYILDGFFSASQSDETFRKTLKEDLKILLKSKIMTSHIIRGIFVNNFTDLYQLALDVFNKAKFNPMELSIDEINAHIDYPNKNKENYSIEKLYSYFDNYKKQEDEFLWEEDEDSFF